MEDFIIESYPQVGDEVYVDSSYFLSHGMDDFMGGKATVIAVLESKSGGEMTKFIIIAERPNWQYNWGQNLSKKQRDLERQFGDQRAHVDPDDRPEFNKWD